MPDAPRQTRPKIAILYNENPTWPDSDKAWTARMVAHLREALTTKDFETQPLKIFDRLDVLDQFDPKEWLIWNWAEELSGQPWTDSIIANELSQRGFAYTGSRAEILSASCDRLWVKKCLTESGVPTLPARLFTTSDLTSEWTIFPAIVKGANQHGSFGIDHDSVVQDTTQLTQRINYMRRVYNDDSLVEPFLDSREFHVAIFGNDPPQALPPAEYDYSAFSDIHDRLYTYTWKYDEFSWGYKAIKLVAPAPADNLDWQARLQTVAIAAYKAVGITDYGRIDLRMLGDQPQVLDVNPNPDIDLTSALMTSAKAAGLTYADVIERIISHATKRMPV